MAALVWRSFLSGCFLSLAWEVCFPMSSCRGTRIARPAPPLNLCQPQQTRLYPIDACAHVLCRHAGYNIFHRMIMDTLYLPSREAASGDTQQCQLATQASHTTLTDTGAST